MTRYVLARLMWMVPMLFGISLLTFVVLDALPTDRAEMRVEASMANADADKRAEAVRRLRIRYGMIDPETDRPVSVWSRYLRWLDAAARFDFASDGESPDAFSERFGRAVGVTVLLGVTSIGIALVLGVAVGLWLGLSSGLISRAMSAGILVGYAIPQFLMASLLVLLFAGGLFEPLLPATGLRDPMSDQWLWHQRFLDLCQHLVLPVLTLSIVPFAIVARHVREAVWRAERSEFVTAMRNWGLPERMIRARLLRHGMTPVATYLGTLIPSIFAGSVVVEQVFALPGIGRLAFDGVLEKDVGVVMAMVLLGSIVTLVALLISDLMHRRVNPRVSLR